MVGRNRAARPLRRLSSDLLGRSVSQRAAYLDFVAGVGGNPYAPLFAHGDGNLCDATFTSGVDGPVIFPRQFVPEMATNGEMLAFCQVHEASNGTTGDSGISAIMVRRSTDNGRTWGVWEVVYHLTGYSRGVTWLNFGSVVVNRRTDRVHVLFTKTESGDAGTPPLPTNRSDIKPMWTYSDSHGAAGSWSTPVDISSSVKKAGGLVAPFAKADEAWGWYIFGPAKGIQLRGGPNAGRLLVPCDHRYSRGTFVESVEEGSDASNESWSHLIYCDDDENWQLGGGVDETNTDNDYANETSIAEIGSTGEVYAFIRKVSGTGSGYKCSSRITGGGMVWEDLTINDGTGGTTNLASASTQGCVEGMRNGDLYALYVGDSGIRSHLSIIKSIDGGYTWPWRRTLDYKMSAYSGLLAVDLYSLYAGWESVPHTADHTTADYNPSQYILARQIPTSEVINPAYDDFYWQFNDFTGTPTAQQAIGQAIKDIGSTKNVHARMGVEGTFGPDGVVTSGSGVAVVLCEPNYNGSAYSASGGPLDIDLTKDWHIEFVGFKCSTTGVKRIADSRNSSAGPGMTATLTVGTNRFQLTLSDNASPTPHTASVTSAVAVNTDTSMNLRASYTAATQTLQLYKDGSTSGVSASLSTFTGNCHALLSLVLGSLVNGTAGCAFTLKALRITKGTRTDFLDGTETRYTLADKVGYSVTTPSSLPASVSTAKLFVADTYTRGWTCGLDFYGGWDKGALPLVAGSGYLAYRCPVSGKLFRPQSQNQGINLDYDSVVGYHHRPTYYSTSANGCWRISSANLGALIDAIQETGEFGICGFTKIEGDTGSIQALIGNNNNGTSQYGFYGFYNRINATTGSLCTRIVGKNGGGSAVNVINTFGDSATGITLTVGTWYFWAMTGAGFGTKLNWFLKAMPGGLVAPTLDDPVLSSANLTAPGGSTPYASTTEFAIGGRSDQTSQAGNQRWKNVIAWAGAGSTPSKATLQEWLNFGVAA